MASQPPSKGTGSYTKAGERTAVTDYRNAARRYAEVNMWGTHDQREQLVSRFAERAIAEWRRRKLAGEKNWPKREQELLMRRIMVEIENGIPPSNIASGPPRVEDSSSFGAQGNVPPSLPPASQGNPLVSGDDKTKISAMRTRGKNDSQVISKLKENIWDSEADKEHLHKVYAEGKVKAFTRRLAKAGGQTVPRPSRKEEDETLADIIRAFGPRRLPADFRPFINGSRFIPGSEAEKAYLENQRLPAPPAGGGPLHATRVPHHMASETYPQGYDEEGEESDTDYEDFPISNSSDVENKRKNRVHPTGRGHGAAQERRPTMPIPQPTTGGRGTGRRVTRQRHRKDSDSSEHSDYDDPNYPTRRRLRPVPATETSPGLMGQFPLSSNVDNGFRSRSLQAGRGLDNPSSQQHENRAQPSALEGRRAVGHSPRHGAQAQQPHIEDDQRGWQPDLGDPLYYDPHAHSGTDSQVRTPLRAGSYNIQGPRAPSPFRGYSADASGESDPDHEKPKSRQPSLPAGGGSPGLMGQSPLSSNAGNGSRSRSPTRASSYDLRGPGAPPASGISTPNSIDLQRSRNASQSPAGRSANSQNPSRAGSNASVSASPSDSMSRLPATRSSRNPSTAGSPGQGFGGSPLGQKVNSPQPSVGAHYQGTTNMPFRPSASPAASTPAATTPPIRQGTPPLRQARPTTPSGPTSTPRNTTPHRNPAPPTVAPATGATRGQGTGGAPHGSGNQGPANKNAKKTGK